MGKKRIAAVDLSATSAPKPKKVKKLEAPRPTADRPLDEAAEPVTEKPEAPAEKPSSSGKKIRVRHGRSRKYRMNKAKIDSTKAYSLPEAIALVKATSVAKFDAKLEAHLNLTESNLRLTVSFPHSTGSTQKVAIADDALLAKLDQGIIDFDILLTTPQFMPKLLKYAKILGPKGLLPNPKSGTVTNDPDKKLKELSGGSRELKGEAKAPLMHVVVGKLSQADSQLEANLKALIDVVTPKRITKLTLAPTMGPSVRVDLTSFQ